LAKCIAWLLRRDDRGVDAYGAAALAGAPDAARQALAREMGLIAALADVVRAPSDREAKRLGGDALAHYEATHRLPRSAAHPVDLTKIIGGGMRAHRLAMRALQLSYAGDGRNEFFFVSAEGGAWFLACIDQISYSVGAAEALSQLVSDNEALLEQHIDARVVDDFAALIEAQGPRADLLAFLGAICSCKGRGVKSNQELCAQRFGLVADGGVGGARRRGTLLLRCESGGSRGLPAEPRVPWASVSRNPRQFHFNMTLYESMRAMFVSRSRELVQG
jgi:hypothetical protein